MKYRKLVSETVTETTLDTITLCYDIFLATQLPLLLLATVQPWLQGDVSQYSQLSIFVYQFKLCKYKYFSRQASTKLLSNDKDPRQTEVSHFND